MKTNYWIGNDLRSFVDGIISSYTFLDYGIVTSCDGETVDVTLASYPLQRYAESSERKILGVRLLYPTSKSFSIRWKVDAGDRVLLLGLRSYVKDLKATKPIEGNALHYDIETLVAYPITSADEEAEVVMNLESGKLEMALKDAFALHAEGDITVEGNKKITINATEDCIVNGKKVTVQSSGEVKVVGQGGVTVSGSAGTLKVS